VRPFRFRVPPTLQSIGQGLANLSLKPAGTAVSVVVNPRVGKEVGGPASDRRAIAEQFKELIDDETG
jgi:hypothetical protein